MLFMVVERFKNRDAKAVYRRFREEGREFEIVPVVPSAETRESIESML